MDGIGVLLILISPLFGWLPGPGGIPVFLAGLWFLSLNHSWARRLLDRLKKKGMNLVDAIFVDRPFYKNAYDILAILLTVAGIYIQTQYTSRLTFVVAAILNLAGLGLFLGNRKRLQKISNYITKVIFKK